MTVLEHDPDEGCVSCPLAWRDVNSEHSVFFFCEAEWNPRYAEARRLGIAHLGKRQVSRHPAPDWCPLRSGPVTVRAKASVPQGSERLGGEEDT